MTQNVVGHLRYTLRLLEVELGRRRSGLPGPGTVTELTELRRQVMTELPQRRSYDIQLLDPHLHPAAPIIANWPPEHELTVALQALVDHAWRPVEFQDEGRFSFPVPDEPHG